MEIKVVRRTIKMFYVRSGWAYSSTGIKLLQAQAVTLITNRYAPKRVCQGLSSDEYKDNNFILRIVLLQSSTACRSYVTTSIRYIWVQYGRTPCTGGQSTVTDQSTATWDITNTEVKHTAIRQLEFEHTTFRVRETDKTTVRDSALWFYGTQAWLNLIRISPTLHQLLRYQTWVPNHTRIGLTSHCSRQSTGITGLISYKPPELLGKPTYEKWK
jgi:hypothetical protein